MPALVCVADAAVCDAHWFAEVVDEHRPDRVVALNAEPTLETVASLAARLNRLTPDKLLVVGGGTVLDTARLAALSLRLGVRAPIFFSRGRQGLLPVPDRLIGPAAVGQMIAVPTTLGTGAETSAVACLLVGDRRRLVMAEALRADVARYFPNCYSTLPGHLIADAILEVVLRVIGPYVVNDAGPADAAAACALRRVDRISEAARTHDPTALAELARLSGETHSPAFSQGRQPFAAPLWYIANELSAATGTSKMHAHRQLLAPWLDAVKRQGEPWGSPARLGEALEAAGLLEQIAIDPVTDFARWLKWLDEYPVAAVDFDAEAVADRCLRHWGLGLGALDDLSRDQILELLALATVTAPSLATTGARN